jgi:hypothetical protein
MSAGPITLSRPAHDPGGTGGSRSRALAGVAFVAMTVAMTVAMANF